MDPEPVLRELFERELAKLRLDFGEPRTRRDKRRLRHAEEGLRQRIFGNPFEIGRW